MFLSNTMKSTITLLLLSVLFIFSSCEKDEPNQLVSLSKDEFTNEEKNEISERLSEEFVGNPEEFPIIEPSNHTAAYGYMRQLMGTMVNTPLVKNRATLNWEIFILNDDNKFDIFGMPNGDIYISTGLLKMIQNESQFISLIAHEIYYLDNNLIMPSLVDEFGGRVFGDILLDKNVNEASEIVMRIKGKSYTEREVSDADNFTTNTICPFEYDLFEYENLIRLLQNSDQNISWITTRKGPDDRLQVLNIASAGCDDEEPMEESRYQMFKDNLLP